MAYTKKAPSKSAQAKPVVKTPVPERPKDTWNMIDGTMNIWVKQFENSDGVYNVCSLTIGRKNLDGSFNNYYMPVKFSSALREFSQALPEGLNTIEVLNGFITLADLKGSVVPCLMITEID